MVREESMYDKFITKYRNQVLPTDIYSEHHHIVPRYMGGTNDGSNLIRLTYRQHVLAHLLLYRKYRNIEDLTAYRLMSGLEIDRKIALCKMIGERHKQTGHIYRLGLKNKETDFINQIKTKESLSRGGRRAGQIAKETGRIHEIRTLEASIQGGKTAGNLAKERGQIQELGKYKGIYVLILPDGREFQHAFEAENETGIPAKTISSRCKQGSLGFSRRKKTSKELENRWRYVTGDKY